MMDVAAFVLWLFIVVRSIVFQLLAAKLLTARDRLKTAARVDFYKFFAGREM